MSKRTIFFSIVCTLICFAAFAKQKSTIASDIIPLNATWKFTRADSIAWMPATVPGSVFSDLLANKKIPNPYVDNNETKVQWVQNFDWIYECSFDIDSGVLQFNHVDINFEGLDTYADVFVNGNKILFADNMFRAWEQNIKSNLKPGQNTLRIYFYSPVNWVFKNRNTSFVFPADNDNHPLKTSAHTRKSPMHYGWDVAPRLVGCGIYRNIKLHVWNDMYINNVFVRTTSIIKNVALLDVQVNLLSANPDSVQIEIYDDAKSFKPIIRNYVKVKGHHIFSIPVQIKNPDLWFPNETGAQPLYTFHIILRTKRDVQQTIVTTGIRTIQVVNEIDKDGRNFYVMCNGNKIFARGANWIPPDAMSNVVTDSVYEAYFKIMHQLHFNMIRVWGGGIYESNRFYDLADRYGIMVWQDFMFSGTMYPYDTAFISNIKDEAEYQVKRLHNHPSLALWCGNNEIDVALKNWGWYTTYKYTEQDSLDFVEGYYLIFKNVLPDAVALFDADRFYMHTSPQSNWGNTKDFSFGDNHYWGVWHGEQHFDSFYTHVPRFASEYGFPSLPAANYFRNYFTSNIKNWNVKEINARQKSYKGNKLIVKHAEQYYRQAVSLDDFAYTSQLTQAIAYEKAIAAHRISKPFCMGSLYWQFNDCWPGITWRRMDNSMNWKALNYTVAKAFEPVQTFAIERNDSLLVFAVNDKREPAKCDIDFVLKDFNGKKFWKRDTSITVDADSAVLVFAQPLNKIVNDSLSKISLFVHAINSSISDKQSSIHYFAASKNLKLPAEPLTLKVKGKQGHYYIKLAAKALAKDIFISFDGDANTKMSNNYFDMIPGENVTVEVFCKLTLEEVRQQIKVRTAFGM
nr:glycoside hydrolase family 2 protein [Bacteroidota bacterium]